MANDIKNKRVNIYIDQQAAEGALVKLQTQADKLTKKISEGQTAGKNMVAALKQLDGVNTSIKKVQEQMDKGLKPSIQQQTTLVTQLRNELKRLSESDPQFAAKLANFKKQNAELQTMKGNVDGVVKSNDKLGNSFEHVLTRIAEYASIYAIFNGIKNFLTSSIEEANKAEQAYSRLQTTLQNIGRLDVFERLKTQAEDLSKEFGTFQGDDVVEVFQKLITYGKLTENQIKELTPVIIDLAAHQKIDLSEATDLVVKSLEGNNKGLKEYGLNIKDASTVTGRFGIVMDELKPKVEGAAKAFGETTQGQIKKTETEIENLKEDIGNKLNPAIKGLYQILNDGLQGLSDYVTKARSSFSGFIDSATSSLKSLYILVKDGPKAYAQYFDELKNKLAAAGQGQQHLQDQAEAQAHAQSVANDASTKSQKEQNKILQDNIALLNGSLATYRELETAGKLNTDEGRKASKQLEEDTQVVLKLRQLITDGNKQLGTGNPNDDGGAAQKALDEAAQKLAALKKQAEDFLKSLADEDFLAKVPNDLQDIALAAKKYFADIKTLADDFNKHLIDIDQFNTGMAQIEEIYKDKIHDITAKEDGKLKIPVEIVPAGPQDTLPTGDELYHKAGFLTPKELAQKAEDEKEKRGEITGYITDGLNEISTLISSINEQQQRNDQRKIDNIDKTNNAEKARYAQLLGTKAISTQAYNQKVAELDKKAAAEKEAIERKEFERNKRASAAQILINAAEAGLKIWAQTGILAGIPLAVLAATTAIELGIVAAQHYAHGGKVLSGEKINENQNVPTQKNGDNVLAYVKKGEVVLNQQQQQALGGDKTFAAIGVPGFQPAYKTRPYMAIDTAGITDTYTRLRYAGGGVVGNTGSINNDPEFKELMAAVLNRLDNPNTQPLIIKNNILLKDITDAQAQKARIQLNATLQ